MRLPDDKVERMSIVRSLLRRLWLAKARRHAPGLRIAASARVGRSARFYGPGIVVREGCRLEDGVVLATFGGRISLGARVYVGPHSVLYGHGGLEIGDDTLIAAHVVIIPANHVFGDVDTPIHAQGEIRLGVSIGYDVWVATGVTILDGVTVGDGAVLGAGAVITRDVPPLAIMVGVPARQVGKRGDHTARDSNRGHDRLC